MLGKMLSLRIAEAGEMSPCSKGSLVSLLRRGSSVFGGTAIMKFGKGFRRSGILFMLARTISP